MSVETLETDLEEFISEARALDNVAKNKLLAYLICRRVKEHWSPSVNVEVLQMMREYLSILTHK